MFCLFKSAGVSSHHSDSSEQMTGGVTLTGVAEIVLSHNFISLFWYLPDGCIFYSPRSWLQREADVSEYVVVKEFCKQYSVSMSVKTMTHAIIFN